MGIGKLELSTASKAVSTKNKTNKPEMKKLSNDEKAKLKPQLEPSFDEAQKRYKTAENPEAIGIMEWILCKNAQINGYAVDLSKPKPGNDLLVRYLEDNANSLEKGHNIDPTRLKYLKAYLPIDLTVPTYNEMPYLHLIIINLPQEIRNLSLEEQAKFILFVMAIIHHESKFNPECLGPDLDIPGDNAVGLMQVRPSTAGVDRATLLDPAQNMKHGMKYLYKMFSRGGVYNFNNKSLALAGYSSGPGRSNELKTGLYARTVLAKYKLFRELYLAEAVDQLMYLQTNPL